MSKSCTPKMLVILAHCACIATQIGFGFGSVLAKQFSLNEGMKPIVFAFIREATAGPILCLMAAYFDRVVPKREHWPRILATGTFLFGNQLCFIVGVGLSNGVTAAIWQPSQPIFTGVIAMLIGIERFSLPKALGILLASLGAVFMVAYGGGAAGSLLACLMFAGNCSGMAMFVIVMKPLLKHYPPLTVIGASYIVASILMGLASLLYVHEPGAFHVSPRSWIALSYWIVVASVMAYSFITFANSHISASMVNTYTTAQVASAALFSWLLFGNAPTVADLGALGILAGLLVTVWFDKTSVPTTDDDDLEDQSGGGKQQLVAAEDAPFSPSFSAPRTAGYSSARAGAEPLLANTQ